LPRLFLPINVIVDAELHEGGSTSFTLVVLVVGEAGLFRSLRICR